MPKYHLKVDWRNGDTVYVGKSGREVPGDTMEALEAAAAAGDADATAVLRDLDMSVDAEGRAHSEEETLAASMALLDNCPECEAARAAESKLSGEKHGTAWPRVAEALAHTGGDMSGRGAGGGGSARMRPADARARAMRRRKMARASRVANRR